MAEPGCRKLEYNQQYLEINQSKNITRSIRMKLLRYSLAATAALMLSAGSQAQTAQNVKERVDDHRQLNQDVVNVRSDRADLDRLSDLVMQWNSLRTTNANPQRIADLQKQIAEELRHNMKHTAKGVAQANREVAQSKQEVRSDRRESRKDRREIQADKAAGAPVAAAADRHALRDDRRDKRDDRKDVRDDKQDAVRADEILRSKRDLVAQLIDLQKQIDAGSTNHEGLQDRQLTLLQKYLTLSREEVKMGYREYAEDREELREDRRETREDVRQGSR
jgi:hypothetical protein